MHLQIKSRLTDSGGSPSLGARNVDDQAGVTVARPGRLLQLLNILADDQSAGGDGHRPFNLTAASGSGIETTGVFTFTIEADPEHEREEYEAALQRVKGEFRRSEIVERIWARLPHREGALAEFIAGIAADGLLIDDIVVGVAECPDPAGAGQEIMVPVQVHAIRPA